MNLETPCIPPDGGYTSKSTDWMRLRHGQEYPKIETLFNRNPEDMKHVILGEYRDPAFELVNDWLVTEKVDGTNVRVDLYWTTDRGGAPKVHFGGRTDAAQIPVFLLDYLTDLFPADKLGAAFDPLTTATLYGEGYGPKIQKAGGNYRNSPGFRLFDVRVGDWWLNWEDVEDVARKLAIETVPVYGYCTTQQAIGLTKTTSFVAASENGFIAQQEGIVCRTNPLLFMRNGERLMWKLKGRDLV